MSSLVGKFENSLHFPVGRVDVEGLFNFVQLVRNHHQLPLGVLLVVVGEEEAGEDVAEREVHGALALRVVDRLEVAEEAGTGFLGPRSVLLHLHLLYQKRALVYIL